jgi:hypothetical protein
MNTLIVAIVMWWRSLWNDDDHDDHDDGTPLSNTDTWTFHATQTQT